MPRFTLKKGLSGLTKKTFPSAIITLHGNGPIRLFLFWSKAGKFNITKKWENCHSSHWKYQQKLKRLKFFRNLKDGWRRRTLFKCKPPEVHFTIRNRVPYNKLLTNRACSGQTGEYWPSVVFVRTSLRSVRTVTTSSQYSPVRPSRSVSKRLLIFNYYPHLSPRLVPRTYDQRPTTISQTQYFVHLFSSIVYLNLPLQWIFAALPETIPTICYVRCCFR